MQDPDWLIWAREIQAIAQTGLAFEPHHYDRERYEALRSLAARMIAAGGSAEAATLERLFAAESGYATPKVDVRGAAFRDGRILLVREVADHHRWTLPGGWADVNLTPAENVAKEMLEETGFLVRPTRLVAVLDRTRQGHTPAPFHAYKLLFLCEITGGAAAPSAETSEVAFFAESELPDDISYDRVTHAQLHRMFAHAADPSLPTIFD
ncbi:MAG: NUDIX hydrolase [Rhodospirillales bacterium]|nr:NUDIX hydrolase [Rhodospirillales bacterium]